MDKKVTIFIFAIVIIPMALMGCSAKATASPTTNPDLIYTAAAQTADVRLTQIFRSTPSATPVTPSPTFDAVRTLAAQTASAILTQSAKLTPTSQGTATSAPVPTSAGPASDLAIFVADVTIPDGTVIAPGAAFTKTWRLQNAGMSTWTMSYSLAFASGEQMGTITSVPVDQAVAPGAQIDVSVKMVAPVNPGSYQGYWKMKNASGSFFNDAVYVLITVGNTGVTPSVTAGTPVGTQVPTSTGIPSNPLNNLTFSVDAGSYTGPCVPSHRFNFTATFTLNQGATLTYRLDASSDTPGFVFDLPAAQTSTFGTGTYSLPFALDFTSDGTGSVWFHVTSPVDVSSNHVPFTLDCTP